MNILYFIAYLLFFNFLFDFDQGFKFTRSSPFPDSQYVQTSHKEEAVKIVFKSTDGGQTWQDISKGLPGNLEKDYLPSDGFFANNNGLFLRTGNEVYHSKQHSTTPFWSKEIFLFPGKEGSIVPVKTGIVAYNFDGHFLQKIEGTNVWLPMYTNFKEKEVRTFFETAGGTIFIGANNRLFKSTNNGKNWKPLHTGGLVMKMAESNGVLLATGAEGILRSTDDGETWNWVIKEGGVGIAVENIKGGFAAITYNGHSGTRRVRTSYDGGKTWRPIDAGLPAQFSIASIIQVGENFLCGHPSGIFSSSDNGMTWKLLLRSIEGKVFNLSVSGNVIYAIPRNEGC